MTELIQIIVNGMANGALYALIALGLTLIYGVMNLSNFAQGEFAMIGAFGTYYFMQMHMNYLMAMILSLIVAGLIGFVIHILAFHPLRKSEPLNMMLSSLGVSVLLVNLSQYLFSPNPKVVSNSFSEDSIQAFGVFLSQQRILIVIVSLILCGFTYWLLERSKFGRSVRAASLDPDTATLYGIPTNRIAFITFVFGVALTGIAGGLTAPIYNVYPTMGISLTLKAFVVVVLGGMGNIPGAIMGGFIVGLIESFSAGYVSTAFQDVIVFSALFLVLIIKPEGILSKVQGEKV
ncbi:branched-chain amino acid ABC transporter permease [Terrilactibacillus sp. BCM23-1]|uniref:Branched-chain amino acid ABC transporter permease n=1 Tax=Terrilactibacillus tamarindi TaxID=2599694 RepID=A0A6N8CLY9_9BACI|nr:branched-chain amino acid ABC transporter permease [Terrilactibacillus tamarindi]MTT31024.1 branched-chain amino acid ABC transporter permease [Terrilactibacillus tamarindi]